MTDFYFRTTPLRSEQEAAKSQHFQKTKSKHSDDVKQRSDHTVKFYVVPFRAEMTLQHT